MVLSCILQIRLIHFCLFNKHTVAFLELSGHLISAPPPTFDFFLSCVFQVYCIYLWTSVYWISAVCQALSWTLLPASCMTLVTVAGWGGGSPCPPDIWRAGAWQVGERNPGGSQRCLEVMGFKHINPQVHPPPDNACLLYRTGGSSLDPEGNQR
jgi:hypothetical protein